MTSSMVGRRADRSDRTTKNKPRREVGQKLSVAVGLVSPHSTLLCGLLPWGDPGGALFKKGVEGLLL